MSDKISICFCINDLYSQHLGVVLTSILENNKTGLFDFYVITNDISQENKNKLSSLKEKYTNFDIKYINIDKSLFKNFRLNMNHISIETYFRYLIADLFPDLNKILYLDVDLIVNGDLTNLWNTDIDDYYCAAVQDINLNYEVYKPKIGLEKDDIYINAGVILFNLENLRKDNITEKFFVNQKKYQDIIECQDQDIINITLKKKIKKLDCVYNFITKTMKLYPKRLKEVIIAHFVGSKKPWKEMSCNRLKRLYYHYLQLSPYKTTKISKSIIYKIFALKSLDF